MKNQKGITLIALIITIIVMLILVGVTINVAMTGGLFEKAKIASIQTQKQVDKEMLLSAVYGSINNNGELDKNELISNVNSIGFESIVENETTGNFPYTCTSKSGNIFYINENGSITEEIPIVTQTPIEIVGNVYTGLQYDVAFLENNRAILCIHNTEDAYYIMKYSIVNDMVNVFGIDFTVSENGNRLNGTLSLYGTSTPVEMTLDTTTPEEMFNLYSTTMINSGVINLYNGSYYCSEISDYFSIETSLGNGHRYNNLGEEEDYLLYSFLAIINDMDSIMMELEESTEDLIEELNEVNIYLVNGNAKQVVYNGHTYNLIESFN